MIYELWLWKNNPVANAAYAKITEEEQKALDKALEMEKYGAGWVLYCDSLWANEAYRNWGITSYQTLEGRIAQTRALDAAGWFRCADMMTLMGTPDVVFNKPPFPNPIYLLYILRANPVTWANAASEKKEKSEERWAMWQESVNRVEAREVLFCNSAWCDGGHPGFGVMAFPSLEARIQHEVDLEKLKWPLYFDAFNLLGVGV